MTRVVVYGEYPPFSTPGAAATLATVQSLWPSRAEEIEVVSPRPSAAHHHAEAGNPKGAAKLARLVGGADFVARFDPGILGESGAVGSGRGAGGRRPGRPPGPFRHHLPLPVDGSADAQVGPFDPRPRRPGRGRQPGGCRHAAGRGPR